MVSAGQIPTNLQKQVEECRISRRRWKKLKVTDVKMDTDQGEEAKDTWEHEALFHAVLSRSSSSRWARPARRWARNTLCADQDERPLVRLLTEG